MKNLRKAAVGQIAVLAFMIIGGTALTGLATGDAQKAYYEKRKMCTHNQMIITWFPVSDKETGKWSKKKIVVPCDEWPSKGETFGNK